MKVLRLAGVFAAASLFLSSAASAEVRLTLQDGRVSIVAHDATIRQILTEWARVGQIKIVNLDRVPGGPQTIELTNVPEAEALEVLLRSVSGFIAAPRVAPAGATASQFDRIVVMPSVAAPRPAPVAVAAGPVFPQPQPPQTPDDDDEPRPPPVQVPPGTPRGPIFNQFPPPQPSPGGEPGNRVAQPFNPAQPPAAAQPETQQPRQPSAFPTAPPGGVAVPGMVAPAPQQGPPGQPGVVQPGQPPQRRPGGIEGD